MAQILVAIHEATHALRIRNYRGSVANWYGQYFTNDDFRALEEGNAQMASAEFKYWYSGILPGFNLSNFCVSSEAYLLARDDFDVNMDDLKKFISRGVVFYKSAAAAISILKSLGVAPIN